MLSSLTLLSALGGAMLAGAAASGTETYGIGTFKQLLDHNDPSKGTFNQKFYWNSQFWEGPGSPVVMMNPGEKAADDAWGYLWDTTYSGLIAKKAKAATVVLEHRYFGDSSPYDTLTEDNLKYLTLDNAIQDNIYFAENVELPFDTNHSSNAHNAPWVLSGGSYSGALTSYTAATEPDVFWAYYASSAPVQIINNYWEYFTPIIEGGLPKNCTDDLDEIWNYLDVMNQMNLNEMLYPIMEKFNLTHLRYEDFAAALRVSLFYFQSNTYNMQTDYVQRMCDYIEGAESGQKTSGSKGVGHLKAIEGLAKWFRDVRRPYACTDWGYAVNDLSCLDTWNPESLMYKDLRVRNNMSRQWQWIICNELGFFQTGAPNKSGVKSIVSRALNTDYSKHICEMYFPGKTWGLNKGDTDDALNKKLGGWNAGHVQRLVTVVGELDPWREASVASDYRPGGPWNENSDEHPVYVAKGSWHCTDMVLDVAYANEGLKEIVNKATDKVAAWVKDYYNQKKE